MLDPDQVWYICFKASSLIHSKVTRAVAALQKFDAQKPRDKKSQLFDDGSKSVILQFGLKTVPPPRRNATKM